MTTINTMDTGHKLICILFKDFSAIHTASSLSKNLNMSRWGVWKILNKLHQDDLLELKMIGPGKTSTQAVYLNWNNSLTAKTISYALSLEAEAYARWKFTFADLETKAEVVILFGSILHSPKTAGDIDILLIAPQRNMLASESCIQNIQRTQEKKIHATTLSPKEFVQELQKPNKIFLDAIQKGVILFGQDKFIEIIKKVQ